MWSGAPTTATSRLLEIQVDWPKHVVRGAVVGGQRRAPGGVAAIAKTVVSSVAGRANPTAYPPRRAR